MTTSPAQIDNYADPIIYFEDPSYPQVPDEYGRKLVRVWRYRLERSLGIYNAQLRHVCTDECFTPITLDKRMHAMIDADDDDTTEDNVTYVAGKISGNHSIYGCPRSGIVHWCSPFQEHRQNMVTGCLCRLQNEYGADCCRFSGRIIYDAEPVYDQFTETTIAPNQRLGGGESKEMREYRIAMGLTKSGKSAADLPKPPTPAERQEHQRSAVETSSLKRLKRNMENRFNRHNNNVTTTPHVIPSFERSPRKVSVKESSNAAQSDSILVPEVSSKDPLAMLTSGRGTASHSTKKNKKGSQFDAGFALRINTDTYRRIKKIIIDLLASSDVRTDLHYPVSALNPADPYIMVYIRRVARIYALITQERNHDRQRTNARMASVTKTNHSHDAIRSEPRTGACLSMNIVNITVTTLYTYARGFNTLHMQNLIPKDSKLAALLPNPADLVWFGIDAIDRRFMRSNGIKLPPKSNQVYTSNMTTSASLQLQQTFSNYPHGETSLKAVLQED